MPPPGQNQRGQEALHLVHDSHHDRRGEQHPRTAAREDLAETEEQQGAPQLRRPHVIRGDPAEFDQIEHPPASFETGDEKDARPVLAPNLGIAEKAGRRHTKIEADIDDAVSQPEPLGRDPQPAGDDAVEHIRKERHGQDRDQPISGPAKEAGGEDQRPKGGPEGDEEGRKARHRGGSLLSPGLGN